jgi:hypothetical protein
MKHKHAELMAEYAKDAMETDEPWERWEHMGINTDIWRQCLDHPSWMPRKQYRRKPEPPKPREWEIGIHDHDHYTGDIACCISPPGEKLKNCTGTIIRVREILESNQ